MNTTQKFPIYTFITKYHFHFRGNYTEFVNTMTEKLKAQQREYEAQMEHRKHVQEFIDKFRFNAKRASLVQSRIKQLEKLPVLQPVEKETEVVLKFPEVEKLAGSILTLSEVTFSYPEQKSTVFQNVDLSATMESRICIVSFANFIYILRKFKNFSGIRKMHRPHRPQSLYTDFLFFNYVFKIR